MKFTSTIFAGIFFLSILTHSCRFDTTQNEYESEGNTMQLPNLRPMYVKELSMVDESKFQENNPDSIIDLNYKTYKKLPDLIEVKSFDYGEGIGKYYCNRTFSNNFKTYIFCLSEGGDCGPSLTLMNIKQDTVLARKILYIACGWEKGNSITQTIFKSDSVFMVVQKWFSEGEVKDSITNYNMIETYKIALNGGFVLLDKSEKKWNEVHSEEIWDNLKQNLKKQ